MTPLSPSSSQACSAPIGPTQLKTEHRAVYKSQTDKIKYFRNVTAPRPWLQLSPISLHCNVLSVIPRLHDQANIEQSSSKHPANAFKIHVHDVCSNCSMFARWLLYRVNGILLYSCPQSFFSFKRDDRNVYSGQFSDIYNSRSITVIK